MLVDGAHDEEIHFDNGTRQTLKGVVHSEQGNWWHKKTADGRYYIINPEKVLFVRIFECQGLAHED